MQNCNEFKNNSTMKEQLHWTGLWLRRRKIMYKSFWTKIFF